MQEWIAAHRTPLLALAVVVAMLSVALAARFSGGEIPAVPLATSEASAESMPELDSDGDGAPDWQEALLGTDPYDPESTPKAGALTTLSATTSITEQFGRSFLYQYLSGSSGATRPISNPAALGVNVANSIPIPAPAFSPYQESELTTLASSAAAQREYYAALERALTPLQKITEAELLVYSRVIGEEEGAREEMQRIIKNYEEAARSMMSVRTPNNAVSAHLSAANALAYYAAVLAQMLAYTDDPVGSLTLLQAYNGAERSMFTAFDNLRSYFALYSINS